MISLLNASHHKLAPRHLLYATLFFLMMYWDYKLVGGFIVATIAFIVGYGAAVSLKEKTFQKIALSSTDFKRLTLVNVEIEKNMSQIERLNISPTLDPAIKGFLNLIQEEFVISWFKKISINDDKFPEVASLMLENMVMKIHNVIKKKNLDHVYLFGYAATQALILHIREFRIFEKCQKTSKEFLLARKDFLHPALKSEADEIDYLRKVADLLLAKVLPSEEFSSNCTRYILREVFSTQVLLTAINSMCESDFVNQQIISNFPYDVEFYILQVNVIEAKGLVENETYIDSPFCSISIDDEEYKTKKAEPNTHPIWNQTFSFTLSESKVERGSMLVQLCDFNLIGKDDVVGQLEVELHQINKNQCTRQWLSLLKPGQNSLAAEVLLEMLLIKDERDLPPLPNELPDRDLPLPPLPSLPSFPSDQSFDIQSEDDTIEPSNYLPPLPPRPINREKTLPKIEPFLDQNQNKDDKIRRGSKESQISIESQAHNESQTHESDRDIPSRFSHDDTDIETRSSRANSLFDNRSLMAGKISLKKVLKSDVLFIHFMEFMENENASEYLHFWMNVESYKHFFNSSSSNISMKKKRNQKPKKFRFGRHRSSSEEEEEEEEGFSEAQLQSMKEDAINIFRFHFHESSKKRIKLDENILQELKKKIFSKRPDANCFDDAQKAVYQILKTKYFEKFLASPFCQEMEIESVYDSTEQFDSDSDTGSLSVPFLPSNGMKESKSLPSIPKDDSKTNKTLPPLPSRKSDEIVVDSKSELLDEPAPSGNTLAMAVTIVREQLLIVDDMIESYLVKESNNESVNASELKTLKNTKQKLEKQIGELLQMARSEVEESKTSFKNLTVKVDEIQKKGSLPMFLNKNTPYIIHVFRDSTFVWDIQRTLDDLVRLHGKLKTKFPKVEKLGFVLQKAMDHQHDKKIVKASMEQYLQVVVSDEILIHSKFVRSFIESKELKNQKQEELSLKMMKVVNNGPAKFNSGTREPQFAFHKLIPNLRNSNWKNFAPEDSSKVFDLPPAQSTELQQDPQKKRESLYYDISLIIETAFALTGEIFDLNGSNFWLQRQAFIFLKHYLHQAHRDKLQNIFLDKLMELVGDESLVIRINKLSSTFFPNGKWEKDKKPRTDEQKAYTSANAKQAMMKNMPELFPHMVGRYNSICGINLLFDMFQDPLFNKQLFYRILDIILNLAFLPDHTNVE